MKTSSPAKIRAKIIACRLCPRLVRHREAVAKHPPKRYQGQTYWARPLPGFGDPRAHLLIVGLAPAANGGNRTGRMFTGDESGNWLARSLYETRFSSQPSSVSLADGFTLTDSYITAAARCAPPENKPTPLELGRCQPFLEEEIRSLRKVRVVVALGRVAFDAFFRAREVMGGTPLGLKPRFSHGAETPLPEGTVLIACYHPSPRNTNTGKLTRWMLKAVFQRARRLF